PTFNLPPFRKCDDATAAESWAFVKNPLAPTPAVWEQVLQRAPRCLEWEIADYERMGTGAMVRKQLPQIGRGELMKFTIGQEPSPGRMAAAENAAVLLTVGRPSAELNAAFDKMANGFQQRRKLAIGIDIPVTVPDTPLRLMDHMALKLVLNTISTGTMVKLGRAAGNWMSYVTISNKKLIDRAIRLLAEIGEMSYHDAAFRLFAAREEIAGRQWPNNTPPPIVPYILARLRQQQ
ncbi:MAG: hypothetical protein PHQ27_09405, partial [Victivallales bacterium]|nr:hypothetical protein [Victivallales bacterium]